jgi:cobaltochelatase CobS
MKRAEITTRLNTLVADPNLKMLWKRALEADCPRSVYSMLADYARDLDYANEQQAASCCALAIQSSPICGNGEGKVAIKPFYSAVRNRLHPHVIMGMVLRLFTWAEVLNAIIDPKTHGMLRQNTTSRKSSIPYTFGWPNCFTKGTAELMIDVSESFMFDEETGTKAPTVTTTPMRQPSTDALTPHQIAIVYGKVLVLTKNQSLTDTMMGEAFGLVATDTARQELDSSSSYDAAVLNFHPVLDEIANRITDNVTPTTTIEIDPAYEKPLSSMIHGATGGKVTTLDGLIESHVGPLKRELDKLSTMKSFHEMAAKESKADLEEANATIKKLSSQVRSQVVAPSTGEAGDLSWRIVETDANRLFNIDAATRWKMRNVKVPTFEWTNSAGSVVAHPDVPLVDPHYVWRPEVVDVILFGMITGQPVWLTGETATGKSTAFEQAAARLGWPTVRLNLDSDISRIDLIGRDTLKNGTSTFIDGPLPIAVAHPCLLICDEIDFGRPEILYALQRPLEGKGVLIPEDGGRVVKPHPYFRMVATSNTKGQGDERRAYAGARILSLATMDRFAAWAEVGYLDWQTESNLLRSLYPHIGVQVTDWLSRVAVEIRKAFIADEITITCSLRAMRAVCEYLTITNTSDKASVIYALEMTLANRASRENTDRVRGLIAHVIA